jgi:hypothetical protein
MPALPKNAGNAWIDPGGKVHVGRWLLESPRGRLMLVWYALVQDSPVTYRYIARIDRVEEQWRVLSVTVQTLG